MSTLLEVERLEKKYGDFAAVKGISFTVEEGEIFGLLGPNGAGKSTTIGMLTGIIKPTSGTARVGGYDIVKELDNAKQLNGLVPQELALYPTLSARANLTYFGRIYGLRGKELKERIAAVLELVALSDRADDAVETFSGGMKRRVNIAAGLLHLPSLLYLDEPTVGVDPQSRNHIFESVQRLNRERGMSIIYTTHYMEEVELLCERVAIIDRGEIIAMDSIKNLIATLGGGIIHLGLPEAGDELIAQLSGLPSVIGVTVLPRTTQLISTADVDASDQEVTPVVESKHPVIKVEAEHSQKALVSILSYLNKRDIEIESLEILEPNLESVFLNLTGKKLRE